MILILAFINDYTCTHTHTDSYSTAHPLIMCFIEIQGQVVGTWKI